MFLSATSWGFPVDFPKKTRIWGISRNQNRFWLLFCIQRVLPSTKISSPGLPLTFADPIYQPNHLHFYLNRAYIARFDNAPCIYSKQETPVAPDKSQAQNPENSIKIATMHGMAPVKPKPSECRTNHSTSDLRWPIGWDFLFVTVKGFLWNTLGQWDYHGINLPTAINRPDFATIHSIGWKTCLGWDWPLNRTLVLRGAPKQAPKTSGESTAASELPNLSTMPLLKAVFPCRGFQGNSLFWLQNLAQNLRMQCKIVNHDHIWIHTNTCKHIQTCMYTTNTSQPKHLFCRWKSDEFEAPTRVGGGIMRSILGTADVTQTWWRSSEVYRWCDVMINQNIYILSLYYIIYMYVIICICIDW